MHKTGTTALQVLLDENRDLLLGHGFCVAPGVAPAHGTVLNAGRRTWTPALCHAQLDRARNLGAHTLILSSEAVSRFPAVHLGLVRDAFAPCDQTWLFCFRHWSSYLPSRWVQYCSRRDTQTFAAYLDRITDPGLDHPDHRFDLVLRHVHAATAIAPVAISYPHAAAAPPGVVGTLLGAMSLPTALIEDLLTREKRLNLRRDWRFVELSRLLNGMAADRLGLPQDDLCGLGLWHGRPIETFDFAGGLHHIDRALRRRLFDLLAPHEVRTTFDPERFRPAERILTQHCFGDFLNPVDGQLFPSVVTAEPVTHTDLDWRDFAALAGHDGAEALDALLARRQ